MIGLLANANNPLSLANRVVLMQAVCGFLSV